MSAPICRNRVEALRESFRATGFWENVTAREVNGKPEIAYGHHRMVALEEEYGKDHKIRLNMRDLDDDKMLKVLSRENRLEWSTTIQEEYKTVRRVIDAYAGDKIKLSKPHPKTKKANIRYAPSFVAGDDDDARRSHPYTAKAVAKHIGQVEPSGRPKQVVLDALAALELMELGLLTEESLEGLTTKQAQAVVQRTRSTRDTQESIKK